MSDTLADLKAQILTGTRSFTVVEGKRYVAVVLTFHNKDTREPFYKRFFHEFWPLLTVAEYVGGPAAQIRFGGAGHGIDGHIIFPDDRDDQAIEFTTAVDGQQEALRMELLEERGTAPASGPIDYTGNKNTNNRVFGPNAPEFHKTAGHTAEIARLMKKVLVAKQNKARSAEHYHGAWLGIVIENNPPWPDMKKRRFDPVCVQLLSDPVSYAPFSRVFVVSSVGDYLFDSAGIRQVHDRNR